MPANTYLLKWRLADGSMRARYFFDLKAMMRFDKRELSEWKGVKRYYIWANGKYEQFCYLPGVVVTKSKLLSCLKTLEGDL